MGGRRLSYGEKSREKACQLLEALLDFSQGHLDLVYSESLAKEGCRCDRNHWDTDTPMLDIEAPRTLLIELVQHRYAGASLIDNKSKLTEALDHLEKTVGCFRQYRKGRQIVQGTFTLWSTETETNLSELRRVWRERKSQKKRSQPRKNSAQRTIPSSENQTRDSNDMPGSHGTESAEQDPPVSEPTNDPSPDNDWEAVFDQLVNSLKQSIPHSPLFRVASKVFGFDQQANISPTDCQHLIQRVKKMWLGDYWQNAMGSAYQWPLLRIDMTNCQSALAQYRNLQWREPSAARGF